jgi:TolA-binding protein
MKKTIIAIACSLLCLGCVNDQYAIERRYWWLSKSAEKIFNNPMVSPPKYFERVIADLRNFTSKNPAHNLAVDAEFTVARLFIVKGEYASAREEMKKIILAHKESDNVCAEALFLLGNSYQLQGKWNAALEEYKKIIREYPMSLKGLEVPIYIAQYYKVKLQAEKMYAAYREAIIHYNSLAQKYPDSPLAFMVGKLTGKCYTEIQEWERAADTYTVLVEKFKGKVKVDEIMKDIAMIYWRNLGNEEKTIQALKLLLAEYPQSTYAARAKILLKMLETK